MDADTDGYADADSDSDSDSDSDAEPPADPVLAALRNVQKVARSRPVRRRHRRTSGSGPGAGASDADRGGYSGARPDATDPQPVGAIAAGYVADRGWERPLSEARVFSDWARIVGSDVAAHCSPSGLRDGELRIAAESTAWATQLRLLAATLLARIVAEVGSEAVTKVVITGPVGPSWKHGPWSVRGARGPRDTYG